MKSFYFTVSRFSLLHLYINPTHLWLPAILCAKVLACVADRAAIGADFVVNLELRWIPPPDDSDHYNPSFTVWAFVLNGCSMLKLFVFIIQCNPVQCDGLHVLNGHLIVSECFSAALYPWGVEDKSRGVFVFVKAICRISSESQRRHWITSKLVWKTTLQSPGQIHQMVCPSVPFRYKYLMQLQSDPPQYWI